MAMVPAPGVFRLSLWHDGGMPVMGSSFALSWLIVHDGVMRRSAAAFSDITRRGTSAMMTAVFGVSDALLRLDRKPPP